MNETKKIAIKIENRIISSPKTRGLLFVRDWIICAVWIEKKSDENVCFGNLQKARVKKPKSVIAKIKIACWFGENRGSKRNKICIKSTPKRYESKNLDKYFLFVVPLRHKVAMIRSNAKVIEKVKSKIDCMGNSSDKSNNPVATSTIDFFKCNRFKKFSPIPKRIKIKTTPKNKKFFSTIFLLLFKMRKKNKNYSY